MASQRVAQNQNALKLPMDVSTTASPATAVRRCGGRARRCGHTRHLTVAQYVRLLAVIDDVGGIATIDEISRALPSVGQPISAVFDLCDAEVLCADWESAFDGDMRVWRIEC